MIDAGRLDRAKNSKLFNEIKTRSICLSQPITYSPHTIASMHAVFSGTYGTRTGVNSYWSTFNFKKNKFKTLTEYLKEENYFTYTDIVNKLVLPKQGFDKFVIHDEKNDDLTERHIKLLKKMKSYNDQNQKFFLYVQYSGIHATILEEVLRPYDNFSEEYFASKEKNEKRYDMLFNKAEDYLEKLLEQIKILELEQNSLILIMSDHGISIGEKVGERAYGAFCYDYTLRTFAYFLSDDLNPIEIKQQVRTIDFMPTILDYLKLEIDSKYSPMDGESLLPLFKGENLRENIAYSETANPLKEKQPPKEPNTFSVRTSKWKFIHNQHNDSKELYDLKNDPNEFENLIEKKLEIENKLWEELKRISQNKD